MNVLIVDDSKAIYEMVAKMLKEAGHASLWAEDGHKAVEILSQKNQIEMILLDWNMPKMTGIEFLEKNKALKFTTAPIIMMTTENSPEYIKKALSLEVAEYIIKPFTIDILLNKMSLIEIMF